MDRILPEHECYKCVRCDRESFLKGGCPCTNFCFTPPAPGGHCEGFLPRKQEPNCFDCVYWDLGDPRCMASGSQWEGLRTSPFNYCGLFERRDDNTPI